MQHVQTHILALTIAFSVVFPAAATNSTPNILLIIADDLGYGDLGCYGNSTLRTPHLDKLAAQGVRLTHNLAAYSLCTPSRAAFLTGRHPARYGMLPHRFPPVFPWTASAAGLPTSEVTVAEVAKKAGYRTALLGKWHQGWSVDRSDPDHHHPLNQGFEYFYGIPSSNMADFGDDDDKMWKMMNPYLRLKLMVTSSLVLLTVTFFVCRGYVNKWAGFAIVMLLIAPMGYWFFALANFKFLNSFVFRNYDLVEQPVHLPSVTRKLVLESEEWLQARHADQAPFLLLLSWLHVHTALATAPAFFKSSAHGLYGDAVQEMDWGVGQLMDMLDRYGMTHNTFVYFTSDHGGFPSEVDSKGRVVGGYNGDFWGIKGDGGTEGAIRVPGIIRWPAGGVAAGHVIHEPVSLMDVVPTVASLLHVSDVTSRHVMDGASLLPLLLGQESVSPHEFFFHYCKDFVHAVRYRPRTGDDKVWKLALWEPDHNDTSVMVYRCDAARHLDPPRLYDLTSDPTAISPLDPAHYPDVTSKMLNALGDHRQSLEPVPSQFAFHRLLWTPWNQPCCEFPKCACEDEKFLGRFED